MAPMNNGPLAVYLMSFAAKIQSPGNPDHDQFHSSLSQAIVSLIKKYGI